MKLGFTTEGDQFVKYLNGMVNYNPYNWRNPKLIKCGGTNHLLEETSNTKGTNINIYISIYLKKSPNIRNQNRK